MVVKIMPRHFKRKRIFLKYGRERPLARNVVEKLGAIVRWREHTPLLCVDKITAAGDFFDIIKIKTVGQR